MKTPKQSASERKGWDERTKLHGHLSNAPHGVVAHSDAAGVEVCSEVRKHLVKMRLHVVKRRLGQVAQQCEAALAYVSNIALSAAVGH